MPTPLIPDMAVFQRRLATLPLATYQDGERSLVISAEHRAGAAAAFVGAAASR